jgi:beta-glucosidase
MEVHEFMVGAATAAHQVEGNNTYSDFWVMEHLKHSDFVEPSGAAVDHYHRYEEDIGLLAQAGLNAYRFSIEWARIEPQEGSFDEAAVNHYRKVLECCAKNNITPIVTLHHFSSPAWLMEKGGWGKPYVIQAFARYVRYIMQQLGNQLPYICTINEANMGYQLNKIAADMMKAGKKEGGVQVGTNTGLDIKAILLGMFEQGRAFHCSPFAVNTFLKPRKEKQEMVVMEAHRAAVKEIKSICPDTKVGLTLSLFDYQPTENGEAAAEKLWQDDFGFYLPYIKEDDFLGVQNYSRKIVDENGAREPEKGAPVTQMGYEDYPASIGNVLRKVAREYHGDLIVTENGIGTQDDARRCAFIKEAFSSVKNCMKDGLPVKGYFYWSLLDNFEWQAGYSKTFGLVAVDRKTQKRYPKQSLYVLGKLTGENETH